jgi:hypothetical protein
MVLVDAILIVRKRLYDTDTQKKLNPHDRYRHRFRIVAVMIFLLDELKASIIQLALIISSVLKLFC